LNSIGTIIVIDTNVTNGSPMPPLAFCKWFWPSQLYWMVPLSPFQLHSWSPMAIVIELLATMAVGCAIGAISIWNWMASLGGWPLATDLMHF
jgi:hypothetical protein